MRFHSLKPDEPKSQKVTATSVEHYNFTLILKDLPRFGWQSYFIYSSNHLVINFRQIYWSQRGNSVSEGQNCESQFTAVTHKWVKLQRKLFVGKQEIERYRQAMIAMQVVSASNLCIYACVVYVSEVKALSNPSLGICTDAVSAVGSNCFVCLSLLLPERPQTQRKANSSAAMILLCDCTDFIQSYYARISIASMSEEYVLILT